MDRYPAEAPREEEKASGRRGIALAVVGALLIALSILDGWPAG